MAAQYKLEDFSKIVLEKVEKITTKRFSKLKPELSKAISEESEKYFIYVADKAIGVSSNPFKIYSKKPWQALNEAYVRRKGHNKFWLFEKSKDKPKLNDWLRTTKPSEIFGKPYVDIRNYNPMARGLQNMTIIARPFPYKDVESRFPEHIYNRLFAEHKVSSSISNLLGYKASNEDMRPIMSPAMQILIRNNIKRRMNKTIKEVINGRR